MCHQNSAKKGIHRDIFEGLHDLMPFTMCHQLEFVCSLIKMEKKSETCFDNFVEKGKLAKRFSHLNVI